MEPDAELSEPVVMKFACPICKRPLQHGSKGYFCARDQRVYHETLGIPDFRVWPDGLFESKMEHAWTGRQEGSIWVAYPNDLVHRSHCGA